LLPLFLSAGVASASNFSFTGTFVQDDQLEIFLFTAPSASTVIQTWSYAGGTNANGQVIPAGGFDPVLSVFDATGGLTASSLLIGTNNDGTGVAIDPATGNAFDSLISFNALPGVQYALVLSESDNLAIGPSYGDGFTQTGNGDFTAGEFGCGGTAFCDATPAQRTGNWAVDITGVGTAQDITNGTSTVPEPEYIPLLATGLASVALLRRRRKQV